MEKLKNPISSMEAAAMLLPYGNAYNKGEFQIKAFTSLVDAVPGSAVVAQGESISDVVSLPPNVFVVCTKDVYVGSFNPSKPKNMYLVCNNPHDAYSLLRSMCGVAQ